MDGILVVNKPQGSTSHDIVDFIRKAFGLKKVGHAGTLDPMATGVLVILIGKMTKASESLMAGDKDYEAALILGAVSTTADAWGKIEPTGKDPNFSLDEIKEVFGKFKGRISQAPPMYSAVKRNGRKLYELARKGITVEVEPRTVSIKRLDITSINLPEISFSLTCSKGTYVRQLAADIGKTLGCGAYLSRLVRTRSSGFGIEEAIGVEELKEMTLAELKNHIR